MANNKMVIGVFMDHRDARVAMDVLHRSYFDLKNVSLIAKPKKTPTQFEHKTGTDVTHINKHFARIGGIIVGLLGLLLCLWFLLFPENNYFISSPLGIALGIIGIIGLTAAGSFVGAMAGGLIGCMVQMSIPFKLSKQYGKHIQKGAYVLVVSVSRSHESDIMSLLAKYKATDIQSFDSGHTLNSDHKELAGQGLRKHQGKIVPI